MSAPVERGIARLPDDASLSFTVRGAHERDAILLLRPLGGSIALWGELEVRLAERFRVVAFDPRGVGASSDVPLVCSTRDMAKDAVALLDVLGIRRAHLFGLSLGGMVASWAAIDAPERVEKLVLASTLPRVTLLSRRALGRAATIARAFALPGVRADVALTRAVLSRRFRREHPERVREIERAVRKIPAKRKNLLRLALAAARHDADRELHRVRMPTLLLFGSLDPFAGKFARSDLARCIPHAEVVILEGAGHDLSLEKPRETAERVIAFAGR